MATTQQTQGKPAEETTKRGGALAPMRGFPFSLSRLRDEFDRWFEQMARGWPSLWEGGNGWRWGIDIRDEDNAVVVNAEAPGFDANDFDIQVTDDRLVLRATKKVETKEEKGRQIREQEFYESVLLPAEIDREKVEAKYHNGILTVTMGKTPASKAKRISVKAT